MKKITIGKSMTEASNLVLGCMRISDMKKNEVANLVDTALSEGINLFDHADIYGGGKSEELFGQVLSENKALRDQMLIQSKCGIRQGYFDFSKEHILSSVDSSLKRLQTDYLDFLVLHRPDTLMEPEEVAEAFDLLKNSGKVRAFGVSNFNSMQIELLQSVVTHPLHINQLQFGIMHTGMINSGIQANTEFPGSIDHDGSILEYCRLKKITIQAWSPFQYGFFDGVFLGNDKFPELNSVINRIAKEKNVTNSAIATAWILRHPANIQTIIGTTKTTRLKEICTANDISLSREEWYEIYRAAGNILP